MGLRDKIRVQGLEHQVAWHARLGLQLLELVALFRGTEDMESTSHIKML